MEAVTATSASNAWAVGLFSGGAADQGILMHWNGTKWACVPSPDPGVAGSDLFGVSASSPGNVWAVGAFRNGGPLQAMAVHCC